MNLNKNNSCFSYLTYKQSHNNKLKIAFDMYLPLTKKRSHSEDENFKDYGTTVNCEILT